jgi:hypothetical protein
MESATSSSASLESHKPTETRLSNRISRHKRRRELVLTALFPFLDQNFQYHTLHSEILSHGVKFNKDNCPRHSKRRNTPSGIRQHPPSELWEIPKYLDLDVNMLQKFPFEVLEIQNITKNMIC